MRNADAAFAVVRLDEGPGDDTGRITVKEIFWTLEHAEQEVARLNELNADKGCRYFWTPTRVVRRDS